MSKIERIERRLEQWRQEFGGPGRPIPEELWKEAAEVARVEGVASTARALRLDRHRLARKTEAEVDDGSSETSEEFVEIDTSRLRFSARTVLRFEATDGERIEVELMDATAIDVVALAEAFWARRK